MNANFEKIAAYIRQHCHADDFSLYIRCTESHETRFAQNRVTQHLAGPTFSINLTAAFDNRTGSASVTQDDPASLDKLIQTACDIASLNQPDPEFIPTEGPKELPQVQNCDPTTKELEPAKMVDIVQYMIDQAKAFDAMVSGLTEKHYIQLMQVTKNGFVGFDESTNFGHSMTLKKGDVETKVSFDSMGFDGFDQAAEFNRLKEQAISLADKRDMDATPIAVILRPHALEDLIWYMAWMMDRRMSDEGFTPFTGQMGKLFFGEKFSVYSTLDNPAIFAAPYRDGIASKNTTWVEKGVLHTLPTNRHWAKTKNLEPSHFFNMYVTGGDATEEEMMQMVPRGVILNRFWYIRTVDAKAGELTGMTRDGVLYFEDGKVRHAVNNFRFNDIPHLATRRILALGPSVLISSAAMLPSLLIDNFNFVDKTTF
ncbi:MAG: metallopeptidase TldD-related protein [Candidatus Cloacimonadaceae bacterium]|jgi:predicted Zn-dependent protease